MKRDAGRIDNGIYDRLGGTWWEEDNPLNLLHGSMTPARTAALQQALAREGFASATGRTALDIGCGSGFMSEELARLGFAVTGIDPSRKSLESARRHAAGGGLDITYRGGAGEDLPAEDAAFDVVVCCDVLEHVADLPRVIAETARVLRPGGLYFFDTINRTPASRIVAIKILQEWRPTRIFDTPLHVWDMFVRPGELAALLERHGLRPAGLSGLGPRANPPGMLRNLARARAGRISYGELSRRLDYGPVRTTALSYMGYALKPG